MRHTTCHGVPSIRQCYPRVYGRTVDLTPDQPTACDRSLVRSHCLRPDAILFVLPVGNKRVLQLSTVSMMSAASQTSERVKQTAKQEESGGGGGFFGIGAKASTSFGKTTSTGVATVRGSRAAGVQ